MIEDNPKSKGMSVTNNIENIVDYICKLENINPVEHYIIYKDSTGIWDGFEFATIDFIPLQETHWLKAATKMIER